MESIITTLPIWLLVAAGLAVLVYDALKRDGGCPCAYVNLSLIGVVAAIAAAVGIGCPAGGEAKLAFSGTMGVDYHGLLAQLVILGGTGALLLLSPGYLKVRFYDHAEYYALMLFAAAGMAALAISRELATIFVNLELVSISVYILAGMEKRNTASTEAGYKYFILGSMAGAFILMGVAFLYGATGSLKLDAIAASAPNVALLMVAMAMLLVGFGFKLTLAPFHMYAPDVYDGAPTPIAAVIATTAKAATFMAFFRIVSAVAATHAVPPGVWAAFYAIAIASMVIGNAGAIVQTRIKRLLAYSSVGHSGYLAIPFVVVLKNPEYANAAFDAVVYYLLAYTTMTILAMGTISALGPNAEGSLANWRGLGRRMPLIGGLMVVAVISLIGVPPTVGFLGKMQLFSLAAESGHYWLAVLGILTSVASAYYYLKLNVTMYFQEPAEGVEIDAPGLAGKTVLIASTAAIFLFAIFPWFYLFQS